MKEQIDIPVVLENTWRQERITRPVDKETSKHFPKVVKKGKKEIRKYERKEHKKETPISLSYCNSNRASNKDLNRGNLLNIKKESTRKTMSKANYPLGQSISQSSPPS